MCPAELHYLWGFFTEISAGLAVTGMAPSVVTWEALDAWCRLRGTGLEPWESLVLVQLGQRRAEIQSEKTKTKDGAANKS